MKAQRSKQYAFLAFVLGGADAWKGRDMRSVHAELAPHLEERHYQVGNNRTEQQTHPLSGLAAWRCWGKDGPVGRLLSLNSPPPLEPWGEFICFVPLPHIPPGHPEFLSIPHRRLRRPSHVTALVTHLSGLASPPTCLPTS